MRRLLSACALASALTLACGDDQATTAATTATATATSTASTSSSATSSATATTSTTATTDASSGGESTGTSAAATSATASSGDTSTGEPTTTGEATGDATTGTTDDTTAGSTSDGTTTGGDLPLTCDDDSDCVLINDCCACAPAHVDEAQPPCDIQCFQPSCDAIGLAKAKAVCRFGQCAFEKVTCNPLGVTCKALPPECAFGQVPSVVDDGNGACWTGYCVPAEACDWVPDCAYCGVAMTCVTKLQKGAYQLCEPTPVDCGDAPATCACADIICESSPPHVVCHDLDDGLGCECPNC
ncbi:MAG: hypothetical protein R3A79_24245 [Nannocystaceae bacterium]